MYFGTARGFAHAKCFGLAAISQYSGELVAQHRGDVVLYDWINAFALCSPTAQSVVIIDSVSRGNDYSVGNREGVSRPCGAYSSNCGIYVSKFFPSTAKRTPPTSSCFWFTKYVTPFATKLRKSSTAGLHPPLSFDSTLLVKLSSIVFSLPEL